MPPFQRVHKLLVDDYEHMNETILDAMRSMFCISSRGRPLFHLKRHFPSFRCSEISSVLVSEVKRQTGAIALDQLTAISLSGFLTNYVLNSAVYYIMRSRCVAYGVLCTYCTPALASRSVGFHFYMVQNFYLPLFFSEQQLLTV